jgi:AcrR family transcriptional regulator
VAPRTSEQFEEMRRESRERILRSALALFARRGFANTSVRLLAEEAGVSQGLLYNYFDGKHELLRAIFARSMEGVQRTFAAALGAPSAAASIALLVAAALETVRDNRDFWGLTYQLRMQPDVLVDLAPDHVAWTALILSRMEEMFERAGVDDAPLRARVLFAAIDGAAQHYVLDPVSYPLDDVAGEIIRLFVPFDDES